MSREFRHSNSSTYVLTATRAEDQPPYVRGWNLSPTPTSWRKLQLTATTSSRVRSLFGTGFAGILNRRLPRALICTGTPTACTPYSRPTRRDPCWRSRSWCPLHTMVT
ncbi:unnamed protein product [Ascophyllum nodosum]